MKGAGTDAGAGVGVDIGLGTTTWGTRIIAYFIWSKTFTDSQEVFEALAPLVSLDEDDKSAPAQKNCWGRFTST